MANTWDSDTWDELRWDSINETMGIVLFAYDSDYEYVNIANVCAALCNKHIRLPLTLITDEFGALKADRRFIHTVIVQESDGTNKRMVRNTHDNGTTLIDWKNLNRANAYELSPYDVTLVLDCDYLVFNENLTSLFRSPAEFACHNQAYDVTGMNALKNDERLSQYSIPMLWATVMFFRKCEYTKGIFEMMKLVQDNYEYYSKVYGFKSAPYRNDFALSIAHHAVSGNSKDEYIPWKLPSLTSMTDVVDFNKDSGQTLYQYKNKSQLCTGVSKHTDLHVMNKNIFTNEMCEALIDYASA